MIRLSGTSILLVLAATAAPCATFHIADGDVPGLIAAINTANASGVPNVINLASGGTYTLSAVAQADWRGPSGLPYVVTSSPLQINGNGATIERSNAAGTPEFRIFMNGSTGGLFLDRITIKGGKGGYGPGIANFGGRLTITNCTITGNDGELATSFSGEGGGLYNSYGGAVLLLNSTISHNRSFGGYGGGGVLNLSFGGTPTITIVNTTIFENRADGPAGLQGRGDAIADAFSPPGSVVLKNSILGSPAQGLGGDCYSVAPVSLGHNVVSDGSCSLAGLGDLNNVNPALGPLTNNGGTTPTHLPLMGSLAIDLIPASDCTDANGVVIATDQRDVGRPQGARCDSGSVEVVSDVTAPVITPTVTGTAGTGGWYIGAVTVTWDVYDPETGISSSSGCGTTTLTFDTAGSVITCAATNGAGLSTNNSVTIKIDQTTPVISGLPAGCILWPPNHQLETVATISASAGGISGMASFSVTGISNEPDNGLGDGDKPGDIVITGSGLQPRQVQLRAERSGTGTGRVYTITAMAVSGAGNTTTSHATFSVPLGQAPRP
ncbi:MAG: hypothetical protein JNN08_12410 [Bryobacterales bacterium]|nr:hypothetical protein [Bryobacterales bacterium]